MGTLKDYLGTLNPVQSAYLASANSNSNPAGGTSATLPIRNPYQLQPYSKRSGNPQSFSNSTSCPATVVAASMSLNLFNSLGGPQQQLGQMNSIYCGGQTLPLQQQQFQQTEFPT